MLFVYIKKHKYPLIIGAVMIFFLSILLLPMPILTKYILDKTIPNKNLTELYYLITVIVAVFVPTRNNSIFSKYSFF